MITRNRGNCDLEASQKSVSRYLKYVGERGDLCQQFCKEYRIQWFSALELINHEKNVRTENRGKEKRQQRARRCNHGQVLC